MQKVLIDNKFETVTEKENELFWSAICLGYRYYALHNTKSLKSGLIEDGEERLYWEAMTEFIQCIRENFKERR